MRQLKEKKGNAGEKGPPGQQVSFAAKTNIAETNIKTGLIQFCLLCLGSSRFPGSNGLVGLPGAKVKRSVFCTL